MQQPLAANNGASAAAATAEAQRDFTVLNARALLFSRFPSELQSHVAFKHFYTDELKGTSGELSLRYFSLFIAYFCALCRLEGRRRHYLQSPSDKAGASFSRAHNRARQVFQRLNGAYSAILMRYNMHSTLDIPKKPKVIRRPGHAPAVIEDSNTTGRYAVGAKPLGPPVSKVRPFEYAADELRFYEELYVFTEQLLRLAFTDDRLQGPITAEVSSIFRSQRFNFGSLTREANVRKAAAGLTATSLSAVSADRGNANDDDDGGIGAAPNELEQNMRHLAEVLVPPAPKISIKEAAVQRTPFVASRFTAGKMSMKKYARPATALGLSGVIGAGSGEKQARLLSAGKRPTSPASTQAPGARGPGVEDGAPADGPIMFPPTHRAVASFLNPRPTSTGGASSVGSAMMVSRALSRLRGGDKQKKHAAHAFLPKLQDFDVPDASSPAAQPGLDGASPSPMGAGSPANLSPRREADGGGGLDRSVLVSGEFTAPPALRGSMATPAGNTSVAGSNRAGSRADISSNAGRSQQRSSVFGGGVPRRRTPSMPLALTVKPEDVHVAPVDPATGQEDWAAYDAMAEIDKVYQSLANGVVITTLAIPGDILCVYDHNGILVSVGN